MTGDTTPTVYDEAGGWEEGLRALVERLRAELAERENVARWLAAWSSIDRDDHAAKAERMGLAASLPPDSPLLPLALAALRAAGGQEKPVCPLTEAGIEHRPHHYLTPVPWDCPGLPAAPVGGQEKPNDTHKPFTDDGVTYCGWDGHEGCGEVWPCSTVRAAAPVGGQAEPSDAEDVECVTCRAKVGEHCRSLPDPRYTRNPHGARRAASAGVPFDPEMPEAVR